MLSVTFYAGTMRPSLAIMLCLAVSLSTASQARSPKATATPSQSQKYEDCSANAEKKPSLALAESEAWLKKSGPSSAAYHCKALALFYLKRFTESAELLEYMASILPRDSRKLWVNVMRQASVARVHAGMTDKALADLGIALTYAIDQNLREPAVELLLDRARLYASLDMLMDAVQDTDHALSLSPGDTKVLLERARNLRNAGKYDLAREDIQRVLKTEPANTEARNALQSLPPDGK